MEFEIIHIETVGSTNTQILNIIEEGKCVEGVVVSADEQIAGRGHAENIWESEKGKNLTFSLALRPVFIEPANQFLITKIISVAIYNLLGLYIKSNVLSIKWPNDIYVDEKKIAGILIQNMIRGNTIDYSVVGIGLNLNQEIFISDTPNAVSMKIISKKTFCLNEILKLLLLEIQHQYVSSVSFSGLEQLDKDYCKNLFRLNEWHEFKENNKQFTGKISGIGEYGRLKIKLVDGTMRQFDFKEVEFLI